MRAVGLPELHRCRDREHPEAAQAPRPAARQRTARQGIFPHQPRHPSGDRARRPQCLPGRTSPVAQRAHPARALLRRHAQGRLDARDDRARADGAVDPTARCTQAVGAVAPAHDRLLARLRGDARPPAPRPGSAREVTAVRSPSSKRAKHRPQHEDHPKRDNHAHDHGHHHIEIAFSVSQPADLKQKQNSAVVRKCVERACADGRQAVHQGGIDAILGGEAHVGITQRVERDRHSAGSRTGQPGEHIHRNDERDQRPTWNQQHRVADCFERRQRCYHSAEAYKTGDRQHRQGRRIGAGIQAFAQGG